MGDDRGDLEKATWTDADFDRMGWHDCALHTIAFQSTSLVQPAQPYYGRLLLDIDYIVKWVAPTPPAEHFMFWLCPATLVFRDAWGLVADLDLTVSGFEPSLDHISQSDADRDGERDWTIEGHEFTISLRSSGFVQHVRRRPVLRDTQRLSVEDRGGLSLAEQSFDQ